MSNLIILPGSKEFVETMKSTKSPRATKAKQPENLVGRTLMLNTAVCSSFQCGGFQLGSRCTFAIVTEESQQFPLHAALAAGKLIDVTGQDLTKGYKGKGGETSAVSEEDTGKKVYFVRDATGRCAVVTPKSKAEGKRFDQQIKKTGTIDVDIESHFTGISSISEEGVNEAPPVKKPTRKTKNVRAQNRKGSARR